MIDLPPMARPVKHSLSIGGHATSVTLEPAFWQSLRAIAVAEGATLSGFVAEIDRGRPAGVGLATALRLVVLDRAQRRA